MTDDVLEELLANMMDETLQTLAWHCPRRCCDPQTNELPLLAKRGGRP